MKTKILTYLQSQRVGVLAVETADGSPHAATVHFAHQETPLLLYFETSTTSKKGEAILHQGSTRASFVIGSDENNMKTLQLDGEVRVITDQEKDNFDKIYFGKFPHKAEKAYDAEQLCLVFKPTWWRFTDWTTPKGKEITLSTD